jgi:hypothetical protein
MMLKTATMEELGAQLTVLFVVTSKVPGFSLLLGENAIWHSLTSGHSCLTNRTWQQKLLNVFGSMSYPSANLGLR